MACYMGLMMLLLAALPVLAQVADTKETFAGTLQGRELLLRSETGASCRGDLDEGTLSCTDGRLGTFNARRTLLGYLAYGRLGGKDLVITIG